MLLLVGWFCLFVRIFFFFVVVVAFAWNVYLHQLSFEAWPSSFMDISMYCPWYALIFVVTLKVLLSVYEAFCSTVLCGTYGDTDGLELLHRHIEA